MADMIISGLTVGIACSLVGFKFGYNKGFDNAIQFWKGDKR